MAKRRGKSLARYHPRRMRSRRGVSHTKSLLTTVLAVGVVSIPLTSSYGTQTGSPLTQFQAGNWAAALYGLQQNMVNGWSALIFPVLILLLLAWGLKKYGARLRLTRHYSL